MKGLFLTAVILISSFTISKSQPVRLKLPRQINVPNYNHFAPSLTADGLTMILATDYYVTEGNKVDLKITKSKGLDAWASPEDIGVINKSGSLNLYGGHCISSDGNKIYYTTRKTGGVGGFDIWYTERRGNGWSAPANLGKPVNSAGAEGFPSLSADGKYLYFIRCALMDNKGCQDCKLYVSEGKGQEIWKQPTEISVKSHVLYPRISKDGTSIIFSSNKAGGKGGYDLYQIKKEGEGWSAPKNLDFINTASDEIYADITSQADAIIYSSPTDGYLTLYRAKLPEQFQPDKVCIVNGKITSPLTGGPIGFLQISDNTSGSPISINKIEANGKMTAVLKEGKVYDLSIVAGNEKFFWSNTYDAKKLDRTIRAEEEISLDPLVKNKLFYGNKPLFDSTSFQLLPGASLECKRLSKLFLSHADWKAEIYLFPSGVSNNPPEDGNAAFEKMKAALTSELIRAGISSERISFINGFGSPEEEESFAGWGIKFN